MNIENQVAAEMPRYQCYKKVWALKIKEIEQSPVDHEHPGGSWRITPDEEGYGPFDVSHEWFIKHSPKAGGYYVVYSDGYKSYSPAEAFEDGYARI